MRFEALAFIVLIICLAADVTVVVVCAQVKEGEDKGSKEQTADLTTGLGDEASIGGATAGESGSPEPFAPSMTPPPADFDDRSLLDLFGEASKEYLTNNFFPPTSDGCDWNWRHGRCEPACECRLRYEFGDFHLGRSCRRRGEGGGREGKDKEEGVEEPSSDSDDDEFYAYDEDDVPPEDCDLAPDNLYFKAIDALIKAGDRGGRWGRKRVRKLTPKLKGAVCERASGRELNLPLRGVKTFHLPEFWFCNGGKVERAEGGGEEDGGVGVNCEEEIEVDVGVVDVETDEQELRPREKLVVEDEGGKDEG